MRGQLVGLGMGLGLVLAIAGPAVAQVQNRPTDAPIITAEQERWYVQGEPVQLNGGTYLRAGAPVFFDGNVMVRTGSFNGVPLYADTSLEPNSLVFVPIGRGLMQPYELPRQGHLAGTTGSRTPSYPVAAQPRYASPPAAALSPTNVESSPSTVMPILREPGAVATTGTATPGQATSAGVAGAVGTSGVLPPAAPIRPARLREPAAIRRHISIEYLGQTWVNDGPAVPLSGSGLVQVGEFAGFPIYTRSGLKDDVIFVPVAGGLVTPYRLKN